MLFANVRRLLSMKLLMLCIVLYQLIALSRFEEELELGWGIARVIKKTMTVSAELQKSFLGN